MMLLVPPAHELSDEPMLGTEEEIVAAAFSDMLQEENPPNGPELHWLVTA
jgi:hypothetical protein